MLGIWARKHDCGIVVEPGEGEVLADTLRRLRANSDRLAGMGHRLRAVLDAHFTRRHALERWGTLSRKSRGHRRATNNSRLRGDLNLGGK
jgi:hypothetical protein